MDGSTQVPSTKESYDERIAQLATLALWLLRSEVRESIGDARYVWLEVAQEALERAARQGEPR